MELMTIVSASVPEVVVVFFAFVVTLSFFINLCFDKPEFYTNTIGKVSFWFFVSCFSVLLLFYGFLLGAMLAVNQTGGITIISPF